MSEKLKPLIAAAVDRSLTESEARAAFDILFTGEATSAQMAGFLMALRTRGETVTEYAAAARVMRDKCRAVKAPEGAIDIVGTGGDDKGTLNISTATAFVVAGAGAVVAKHGNRNISSRSGAADVLGEMGIEVMVDSDIIEKCLKTVGIGFMMAPMHHPVVRYVMPVRQELGTRTIFNILGPLANPAGVKRQLTGAFSPALIRPMAEALKTLGVVKAWLVHGGDGTDEIAVSASTSVVILENDTIHEMTVHPEDAGLPLHSFDAIRGGSPSENARAFRALLQGKEGAYRDAVLLNAAAALVIADRAPDLKAGVEMACISIDSGAAKAKVEALAQLTNSAKT